MQTSISLGKAAFASVSVLALLAGAFVPRVAHSQGSTGTLESVQVKDMVTAMGYECKALSTEAGKEKYEFSVDKSDLKIPIAFETSASKRYIWLTVYLGDVTKMTNFAARADKILRQNTSIQPCQFYVTKSDRLMLALAIENRGPVDPVIFRRSFEKVADDVSSTKDLWSTP